MNVIQAYRTNVNYRPMLIGSVAFLVAVLFFYTRFLLWANLRTGLQLHDPIVALLPPADLSFVIFVILYGLLALCFTTSFFDSEIFVIGITSYAVLSIFRILCIYLVPLQPPIGMVALDDPITRLATDSIFVTKDLFFSGHTATLALFVFLTERKWMKVLYGTGAFLMAVLVMFQHMHYAIDVLAAPIFSAIAYYVSVKFILRAREAIAVHSRHSLH